MKSFYITTPIYYVNSLPHIGHAFTSIMADVLARYNKLQGKEVFFLTGTDEHGTKIARAAEQVGKNPKEFCNEISDKFRQLHKVLNISNNDFIRTTDRKKHWPTVKKVWLEMKKKKDIYKKSYKGFYCVGCEAFVSKRDLIDGKCIYHQKEPEVLEEENYFFKLSKYSKRIEQAIRKDKIKIIPEARKKEMLSFIGQGLEDVSFSRSKESLKWGIPVPDDDNQTIYVWADALTSYISALGFAENSDKFKKFWPADVHIIGKDIQKFHCLIWPGILMSLGLSLPKNIFIHGFISINGQKMSKSLGNVIDPFELTKKYGLDSVRYFLLREIPPTEDGDFSYEKLENRYNSDLASGIGNLVARVIAMAKKSKFQIPDSKKISSSKFQLKIKETQEKYKKTLDNFKFNEAFMVIWGLISFCDKYIEKEKPWKLSSSDPKLEEILSNLMFSLKEIAELLKPFLPETSEKILEQIKAQKSELLFPRINVN